VGNNETRAGISWYDVRSALRAVGRAHNGACDVLVTVPMREDLRHAVDVRVRFRRFDGGSSEWVDVCGISSPFPCGDASTIAGLCFRLAYDLEHKLEQLTRGVAERGQDRLPGF
jgi:hypothetical protein